MVNEVSATEGLFPSSFQPFSLNFLISFTRRARATKSQFVYATRSFLDEISSTKIFLLCGGGFSNKNIIAPFIETLWILPLSVQYISHDIQVQDNNVHTKPCMFTWSYPTKWRSAQYGIHSKVFVWFFDNILRLDVNPLWDCCCWWYSVTESHWICPWLDKTYRCKQPKSCITVSYNLFIYFIISTITPTILTYN